MTESHDGRTALDDLALQDCTHFIDDGDVVTVRLIAIEAAVCHLDADDRVIDLVDWLRLDDVDRLIAWLKEWRDVEMAQREQHDRSDG